MALITHNPTTPGKRHLISVDLSELYKGSPEKTLTKGLSKTGGRNNHGHITSRHRGGGHKRSYRMIDFKRNKLDMSATVERLEYDPNRTAFIALIKYEDGTLSYIIAPAKLKVGDVVISSSKTDVKPGNAMELQNMPVGTIIHNVELKPGAGAQLARSAGCYVQLVGKDGAYAQIRLNSGELRMVLGTCRAVVGSVSNADHQNATVGKAGRSRWLGIRPQTRGIAMNPVDHPHGGRGNGGTHPMTPWGKCTRGAKTRTNKKTDRLIIRSRHMAKKK